MVEAEDLSIKRKLPDSVFLKLPVDSDLTIFAEIDNNSDTGISISSYPIELITNTASFSRFVKRKSPELLVGEPLLEPFTRTETPARGSLASLTTLPRTSTKRFSSTSSSEECG